MCHICILIYLHIMNICFQVVENGKTFWPFYGIAITFLKKLLHYLNLKFVLVFIPAP